MSGSRIAIVGMSCRIPGAPNPRRFWQMLRDGVEGIRWFTSAELAAAGVDEAISRRPNYVPACGALDNIEEFDADFFGVPPREAEIMDPQHRIFLELAWEALEDAGYAGDHRPGRTGVYAGAGLSTYLLHNLLPSPELGRYAAPLQILIANNKDSMAARVSYRLNLSGPSLNISSACSTSLVAVHVACQALLNQECDVALAGGIGIQIPQDRGYLYEPEGILSPDGHCRAFDARATGTVSGNGGGIVVLKRLEDAEQDRDAIRAVILATAINNDGARKAGFTAPSVAGQAEVIMEALELAAAPPETIGYIETHGTGTPVGDPIELKALTEVFRRRTPRREFCAIGSVKTNVGHLDEGAGVAGLIKTVLALEHRQLPPSLHFTEPNPECELPSSPFYVNTALRDWPVTNTPRRAGVSSFGIGGTNAHAVLEEAPSVVTVPSSRSTSVLTFSARSPRALDALADALATRLEEDPSLDIADVAYTLQTGRRVFPFCRSIVCRDRLDAIAQLRRPAAAIQSAPVDPGRSPYQHPRRRVSLPTTPFERRRYWIEAPRQPAHLPTPAPQVDKWLYAPGWTPAPRTFVGGTEPGTVVVFIPDIVKGRSSWSDSLTEALRSRCSNLVTVLPGAVDYDALVRDVVTNGHSPFVFVHQWQVTGTAAVANDDVLAAGFDSLLGLARALGRAERGPIKLAVLTDGAQFVDASDLVRPEKSTTSGLIRSIAVEYPSLACAHLDLDAAGPASLDDVDAVTAEILQSGAPDVSVAYRTGRRWIPQIRAIVPRPEAQARDLVRDGGVYLITGGLGSMGLAFAEWIAGRANATVVLAAREHPAARALAEIGDGARRRPDPAVMSALDRLCGRLILEYVTGAGVDLRKPARLNEAAIVDTLGIAPRYRKMLDWCVGVLQADGVLDRHAGAVRARWDGRGPTAEERANQLKADVPGMTGLVDLIVHCARHYGDVLSGRVEGTEVLYPDGTPAFLDAGFKESVEYASDRVYLDALGRHIASLASRRPDRPLKILEVGGGTGTLTDAIYRHLDGRRVEYTFTDVSRAFLAAAEAQAKHRGLTGISFRRLDISRAPASQGFDEHAYDVVLGYNVVHATRDVRDTLRHLRGLLAGDGHLCLVETVKTSRWDQMIWGLATGWWDYDDDVRAGSPLLGLDGWERVVKDAGFDRIESAPHAPDLRESTDAGLIVARVPDTVRTGRSTAERIAAIEARGSRVRVARVDISDAGAVHQLVQHIRTRHGRINGVIHTAGVIGRGFIRNKTLEAARSVLAPKLGGARALEAALASEPPDFLVLCSGLAGRYPVAGQADYAAANAALDGFAYSYGKTTGTRVVSIGWGFWQELGMIAKSAMPREEQERVAAEITANGWGTAGVEALEAILFGCDMPEVLVYPHGLPEATAAPASDRMTSPRLRHPLLLTREDEQGWTSYRAGFSPDTRWMLDEHRLGGQPVLPGTAYLELMRAAYADLHGADDLPMELREVFFLQPLAAEPDRAPELRVLLRPRGATTDALVVSRAGGDRWHVHARGEMVPGPEGPGLHVQGPGLHVQGPGLGALGAPDLQVGGFSRPDAELARRLSGFGPRWDNVTRVSIAGDEAAAVLQLPPPFESETSVFGLHPALLDNATGYFSLQRQTEPRVPFSYQSIKVRGSMRGAITSRARAHGVAGTPEESFDLVLSDESGSAVVEISGYKFRRLVPASVPAAEALDAVLQIGARGSLDTLAFAPATRRAPGPDEVEIRVEASALNFIEVLYGLGLLPERRDQAFPFGLECAGVVERTGENVTSVRAGQRVAAFANGTDRLFTTVPARLVVTIPPGLSFEDAATIPAAYMTAYAALIDQGRVQPGERVLIHSACGGVGLAAVHVARWVGARIFATAGTDEKRDYLRRLGIETVMDSRRGTFAGETLAATGGAGVDVVLNSLSGELIEAGLSVLAPGGRFLELGKRDILEGARLPLSHFQRRLSFIAVDVGPDLPQFDRLWHSVWARVASGDFPPLPRKVVPARDAAAAFVEMARGRHIGKFVLSFADRDAVIRQASARPADRGRTIEDILDLATPAGVRPRPAAQADAPATDVEQAIAGIWEDLLGRTNVGREEDFFALNGDSLVGAQVISRIHQAFGVKIPLSAIFDHPTVAQLGLLVRQVRETDQMEEGVI